MKLTMVIHMIGRACRLGIGDTELKLLCLAKASGEKMYRIPHFINSAGWIRNELICLQIHVGDARSHFELTEFSNLRRSVWVL